MKSKKTVGIIGFGRFGRVLAKLLGDVCTLHVYDKSDITDETVKALSLDEVCQCKSLFLAVPIRALESILAEIAPKLSEGTVVIDVCSVKVYPVQLMQQYLPDNIDIIASHPMFGPDSIAVNNNLRMMWHVIRNVTGQATYWQQCFSDKGIELIEITPDKHDRMVAYSQGITHFLGRALEQMDAQATAVDTVGYQSLLQVMQQTCYDSWELFSDLQNYNPYSQQAIERLHQSLDSVTELLKKTEHNARF